MISIKELDYVNLWANKVPYPGEDYCNDVKLKLQNAFNLFIRHMQIKNIIYHLVIMKK